MTKEEKALRGHYIKLMLRDWKTDIEPRAARVRAKLNERGADITTGGAGTGKTTEAIKRIKKWESDGETVLVVAPTNKAKSVIDKRLRKKNLKAAALTLHKALADWLPPQEATEDELLEERERLAIKFKVDPDEMHSRAATNVWARHIAKAHETNPISSVSDCLHNDGGRPAWETISNSAFDRVMTQRQRDEDGKFTGKRILSGAMRNRPNVHRLVVDEFSMLGSRLWDSVFAVTGGDMRLNVYGDQNQLGPISGPSMLLGVEAEHVLTTNWRSGDGSPLDLLAKQYVGYKPWEQLNGSLLRAGCDLWPVRAEMLSRLQSGDGVAIAYANKTIALINGWVRENLGYPWSHLVEGERVMLMESYPDLDVWKSETWEVAEIGKAWHESKRALPGFVPAIRLKGKEDFWKYWLSYAPGGQMDKELGRAPKDPVITPRRALFYNTDILARLPTVKAEKSVEISSAYAVTVHRMQGDEANFIYLLDESEAVHYQHQMTILKSYGQLNFGDRLDPRRWDILCHDFSPEEYAMRWMYVAVSRARKQLYIEPKRFIKGQSTPQDIVPGSRYHWAFA